MVMRLLFLVLVCSGCHSSAGPVQRTPLSDTATQPEERWSSSDKRRPHEEGWFASFTPMEAKKLDPEAAKAIVIARAAIEEHLSDPIPMDFR